MEVLFASCSFAPVFPYDPDKKRKQPQLSQSPEGFPLLREQWLAEFETFPSSDGKVKLFSQIFRPSKWEGPDAHRILVVLHGQGEHSGRYVHFPFYVGDTVSAVYLLDHRGHGKSKGSRGHVDHFDLYAQDAALAINRIYDYLLEKFGKAEVHLLGHSMGGQIALRTLLLHPDLPVSSVSLAAPMFDLAFPVPKIKEFASHVAKFLAPGLSIPGQPLDDYISSDAAVRNHYKNDPLVHGMVSPAFYHSYLEVKEDTLARAEEIDIPLMVQVAMDDKIIRPGSIVKFFKKLKVDDKALMRYDHFYHEIYNEPEKERAFGDLCAWIEKHKS